MAASLSSGALAHIESGRGNLAEYVQMWPTPQSRDDRIGMANRVGDPARHGGWNLPDWAAKWPTPASRDYRHPNAQSYAERGGGTKGEQLPNAVGGALNPTWVEALMGLPPGWTDLGAPTGKTASRG